MRQWPVRKTKIMVKQAFWVRLKAKAGREKDLESFLYSGLPMALAELGTIHWYAIRLSDSTFAIFDTFEDEAGRDAHLNGPIAKALMEKAPDLLTENPFIEKAEVLAVK